MLCCVMLRCVVLRYVMCDVLLCCVTLCCDVLCYVVRCSFQQFIASVRITPLGSFHPGYRTNFSSVQVTQSFAKEQWEEKTYK